MKLILKTILTQLRDLPVNLLLLVAGVVIACLSEADTMMLAVFGVLLGFLVSWQVGLLVFFGLYTAIRFINNWVVVLSKSRPS